MGIKYEGERYIQSENQTYKTNIFGFSVVNV